MEEMKVIHEVCLLVLYMPLVLYCFEYTSASYCISFPLE